MVTEKELEEAMARAIAVSQGMEPDEDAPIWVMCKSDNSPVSWWRVYEEQAKAALSALKERVTLCEKEPELRRTVYGGERQPLHRPLEAGRVG